MMSRQRADLVGGLLEMLAIEASDAQVAST